MNDNVSRDTGLRTYGIVLLTFMVVLFICAVAAFVQGRIGLGLLALAGDGSCLMLMFFAGAGSLNRSAEVRREWASLPGSTSPDSGTLHH